MWIIVLGFVVGILLGVLAPFTLPIAYSRYLSIAVLAALDTAFGGLRASMEGTYDNTIFISGFFMNALLAAGLVYLGDRIGVESLYMAGVVAMGIRMFQNLGIIRRLILQRWGFFQRDEETLSHHGLQD